MPSLSCTGSPEEIKSFESGPKIASAAAVRSPDLAPAMSALAASLGVANTLTEVLLDLPQPVSTTHMARSSSPSGSTLLHRLNHMSTSKVLAGKKFFAAPAANLNSIHESIPRFTCARGLLLHPNLLHHRGSPNLSHSPPWIASRFHFRQKLRIRRPFLPVPILLRRQNFFPKRLNNSSRTLAFPEFAAIRFRCSCRRCRFPLRTWCHWRFRLLQHCRVRPTRLHPWRPWYFDTFPQTPVK